MKRGEFREALDSYQGAARLAPYDPAIQEYIAKARSKLGTARTARSSQTSPDGQTAGLRGCPWPPSRPRPSSSTGTPSR